MWCGVVWRGVAWCGVVWCGVFFGSTLLQHRAREAAPAGEKAASLQRGTTVVALRALGWRWPPFVPAAASEACIRHRPGRCAHSPHLGRPRGCHGVRHCAAPVLPLAQDIKRNSTWLHWVPRVCMVLSQWGGTDFSRLCWLPSPLRGGGYRLAGVITRPVSACTIGVPFAAICIWPCALFGCFIGVLGSVIPCGRLSRAPIVRATGRRRVLVTGLRTSCAPLLGALRRLGVLGRLVCVAFRQMASAIAPLHIVVWPGDVALGMAR